MFVFGESTCVEVVALVREAARVARVVGAAAAAGADFCVGALVRFFGMGRSAFSLSSPDNSSLLRFLARVVFVG